MRAFVQRHESERGCWRTSRATPLGPRLSPVATFQLLSMRFDAIRFSKRAGSHIDADEQFASHRLIELFVPGPTELWGDGLVPKPWTLNKPVRLVTARTILLAGMATFLGDRNKALCSPEQLLASATPALAPY